MSSIYLLMSVSLLPISNAASISFVSEPISISGVVVAKEVDEDIPVTLNMVEGHPFAAIMINLYENNKLVLQKESVSKYISTEELYFNAFSYPGELKSFKIEVYYIDAPEVGTSTVNFNLICPCYEDQYVYDNNTYTNPNWYSAIFTFCGSSKKVNFGWEKVTYSGPRTYTIDTSRFIDFSYNFFEFSSNYAIDIDTCELRIYYKFEGSDFLYKNGYTSIDLNLYKVADNYYQIDDEYRFYVAKADGMINENFDEDTTYDDAMPFYIPISFKEQKIHFEIVFSDIGNIHDNYIFPGTINITNSINDDLLFGGILDYMYQPQEPLKDIRYE